ncbi:hypothetical protein KDA_36140 [Dictyobacter alpinus]|uniref:Uncharacterized protein n=1 Tax=Dictyobacter alpinus TaxID=2014873 RepID=A0A402BA00_9CHLR|nr:hypothetical protein [Dictyobacter alpinus]GCE28130.1 hypothetical protein KDA_36140 [Dictyobacter alpinus]
MNSQNENAADVLMRSYFEKLQQDVRVLRAEVERIEQQLALIQNNPGEIHRLPYRKIIDQALQTYHHAEAFKEVFNNRA